jgi:hypothetical protein
MRRMLYESLLQERAEEDEERRRGGGPLPPTRGSGSKVLDRQLADASKERPSGYAADLSTMHRLMTRGVHSQGDAYRFHGLKRRYEKEHAELAAEAQGQGGCCTGGLRLRSPGKLLALNRTSLGLLWGSVDPLGADPPYPWAAFGSERRTPSWNR